MKKKMSYLLTTILVSLFCMGGVSALTPTLETDHVLNDNKNFFANGTSITITAREDGVAGAKITWDGGEMLVDNKTHIFGGSHNSDVVIPKTSITMYGGTVANIFGAGLHTSYVTDSSVVIYGGSASSINGGGASSANWTDCHRPWYATSDANAINQVANATVILNGGSSSLVFGGNEGMGYTGHAAVTINDGTWGWVTAGAVNGYTGSAETEINGGTITVLQSINRGHTEEANVTVNNGTIGAVYVTGETGDATVTGGIGQVNLAINGGVVTTLDAGRNNNAVVTEGTTDLTANVTYLDGTVENDTTNLPVEPVVIGKHDIIVEPSTNGNVEVSETTDVKEGSEVQVTVTPDEGYRLDKLVVIDAFGNVLNVVDNKFQMPNSDVTVKAEFVLVAADNEDQVVVTNPNTYDGIETYFGIGFVGLLLFGYATKQVFLTPEKTTL